MGLTLNLIDPTVSWRTVYCLHSNRGFGFSFVLALGFGQVHGSDLSGCG